MSTAISATSSSRLRRSARAPKKSAAEYTVGDVVEIQRNGATVQARLIQLLTEGTSSPNPRWLIRLGSKDEEVYEHIFVGKVSNDEDLRESPVSSSAASISPPEAMEPTRPRSKKDDHASDSSARAAKRKASDKASSREARSRRRQEKDDGAKTAALTKQETMDSTTLSSNVNEARKRKVAAAASGKRENAKATKTTSTHGMKKEEEECLKIKFLTGTLYLYRGRHRRAEFVRRV